MNVLFIAGWYPNSTFIYQGIFIKKHAQALQSVGVNLRVVAFTVNKSARIWENNSEYFKDENGVDTLLIEVNSVFHKFLLISFAWQYRFLRKYIAKYIPDFKPQIVHSNVLFPAGILGYKLSEDLKVPHVMTEHWSKADAFIERGSFSSVAKKALEKASFVMPVSNYLAGKLKKFIPENKLEVVPNTVDTTVFEFAGEKRIGESLVFACLANWQPPKRPDLIFEGLSAYVKKTGKTVKLISVGGGSLIQDIKKKKWNYEVKFYDFISSGEINNLFKDVDFLLHASENETFSIILAEAGTMGIPMVASRRGAMPELINERNGILTENTIEEWVKAIEKLVSSSYDRKQISEEMKKNVSHQSVGHKYKTVYEKAINP